MRNFVFTTILAMNLITVSYGESVESIDQKVLECTNESGTIITIDPSVEGEETVSVDGGLLVLESFHRARCLDSYTFKFLMNDTLYTGTSSNCGMTDNVNLTLRYDDPVEANVYYEFDFTCSKKVAPAH